MSKDEERLEFLKSYENKLIAEGTKLIVGIDEAGRGPLAGPVSVAAVIMKPESNREEKRNFIWSNYWGCNCMGCWNCYSIWNWWI